ncbi:hypothetical protein Bca4012_071908 [Brassica carinata]
MLSMSKNVKVDPKISRAWPWILWYLWKHRNGFLFEGKSLTPDDIASKAYKEADEWFMAQQIEGSMEREVAVCPPEACPPFIAPPKGWVKCEIEMEWSKGSSYTCVAWIVRNDVGRVLQHSRRALPAVPTLLEAKLQVSPWAVESMRSLRYQKVSFSYSFDDLSEVVVKPCLWPALQYEASDLRKELQVFVQWELKVEALASVSCASFIAQSVVNLGLTQSYVASGHPRWLDKFFVNEKSISCQLE